MEHETLGQDKKSLHPSNRMQAGNSKSIYVKE